MYTHIRTTNVIDVASHKYVDDTTCFPLQLTENPAMADRHTKPRGAAGRTVAGAATAVNPAMIDENGSFSCLHSCIQCCVETEMMIGSPSTLAQSYVNCVATFVLFRRIYINP